VVIHRSRGLVAEWQPPWHLPRTTVEDTVLDLIAAARTFDDAYGWISAAVGRRLSTPELLGKALAARSRMRWRGWVTAALHDAAGASTRRLSGGPCTASSAPTGCLRRGGRPGAGMAAVTATWTTCTSRSGCAWS
jgi:hypothetical protein